MQIEFVHFYVEQAETMRDWLVQGLGFRSIVSSRNQHTQLEVVEQGAIRLVLSSPLTPASPVTQYLRTHPPGVVDLAFRVEQVTHILDRGRIHNVQILQPLQTTVSQQGMLVSSQIAAWGCLRHTLIERTGEALWLPPWLTQGHPWQNFAHLLEATVTSISPARNAAFTAIDHVVLNVEAGQLAAAARWYQDLFDFQPQQHFTIETGFSGLYSQVMAHPQGNVQLPINEPTSANSQIQEFLDVNGGAGIQHIALSTPALIPIVAQLRQAGIPLISVPPTYYTELQQRAQCPLSSTTLEAVTEHSILVDWQTETYPAVLLQTFSQPIFQQPTFFFEFIERQICPTGNPPRQVEGFGEGNFRALFEAVEREQLRRSQSPSQTFRPLLPQKTTDEPEP